MIESYVKTKMGRERIKAYEGDTAPLPIFNFKPLQRNHKVINYATDFITLDTETSHSDINTSWVYQWAIKMKNIYIYGRRPSELIEFLKRVAEHYELKANKKMIIFIHNASYDLQYLKHYIREYDPETNFLAIDAHSILICDCLGFRILCSYKLTNLSLAALSKNYATTYDKAVGEINYSLLRFQDQELSDSDWYYMFSDVAAQYDGIKGYLKSMGYKYAFQAPFTSTGFVRTECRRASKTDEHWREEFKKGALDLEMYNLCRWGFMGGVTISSFLHSGETIRSDKLRHKDFTSSYPARQMLDYMPVGAPSWYGEIKETEEFEYLLEEYCCVFELTLYNVHIRKGITAPCIPSSKCVGLHAPVRLNGKICSADTLTIAITEIDYKWIKKQYTWDDMKVSKMLIFERGTMPDWLKTEIMRYFSNKCLLKNKDPLLYSKSKALLNCIYGMTATSIIREEFETDENFIIVPKEYEDQEEALADQENRLHKYYSSYNSFMPYQYSLYTTAWARDALFTMIECVGYENFLYCDTDSVFYIETPENKKAMEEYTEKCKQRAIAADAYVGNKYLGMPTDEPPIRAFRALHAKCYAMEEWDDAIKDYRLNVVIAGIPKKAIKWIDGESIEMTNAEELGSIDNLNDGFIFTHCGGTRCVYNEQLPEIIYIDGHKLEVSSSAVIENIEKTISDTMWTVENGSLLKLQQEQN